MKFASGGSAEEPRRQVPWVASVLRQRGGGNRLFPLLETDEMSPKNVACWKCLCHCLQRVLLQVTAGGT